MYTKISKETWYAMGGFRNSNLFRRGTADGDWTYWVMT